MRLLLGVLALFTFAQAAIADEPVAANSTNEVAAAPAGETTVVREIARHRRHRRHRHHRRHRRHHRRW